MTELENQLPALSPDDLRPFSGNFSPFSPHLDSVPNENVKFAFNQAFTPRLKLAKPNV